MSPQKRQGSPITPKKDGKAMKALSLTPDDDNQTNNKYSVSGSTQNGNAHGAVIDTGSVNGDSLDHHSGYGTSKPVKTLDLIILRKYLKDLRWRWIT